uniref:Outer dynein arm-docking complex subunit 4 n=1 Tax=Monopterus albus TaxID=43700 RepID=A0A3Q3IZW7_MONAL
MFDFQKPKSVTLPSTLTADGDWLYLKGEYKKAIDSFTKALTLKPSDKNCYVGRSKCYLNLGQPENALKDAEASLNEDKSFFEGLYQKAEALYYMGEFEFALEFYHRGQKLRPQIQEFRLGIQKAQEAIENSVGNKRCVIVFYGLLQIVTHMTKKHTSKSAKSERTTKQMLREFYSDKKYLENLLKDEDLVNGKTKGGERLQDVIQSSLTYLDTCTEFWNQEKPICTQEKDRKIMQQTCSQPHYSTPSGLAQFLLKSLDDIDKELTSGNAKGSLKKAEEVMKLVQGWSEKEVPNKKEVLATLHGCIGNALIDLGDMDNALNHHQKYLKLLMYPMPGLCKSMSSALDNIGRVYAQTGQFTQAIEFWEKKIPLVRGGLEKTWLLHEIGRCYLELNRYEESRDYGVRSLAAADEIADGKWQINANVLVAQSQFKMGNFEAAVTHFERALTYAGLEEDDSAMNAIHKALHEAQQQLSQ